MKRKIWLAIMALALMLPLPMAALEIQKKDLVFVAQDQVIDRNFYGGGSTVEIYGTINGDIFVAGRKILIDSANINGDVFVAGDSITIKGKINGSVRAVGNYLDIAGEVRDNVLFFGKGVTLEQSSKIGGHLTTWGQLANLNGQVVGQVEGGMSMLSITGQIGKDVEVMLSNPNQTDQALQVSATAVIGGKLKYKALEQGNISDQAQIVGGVEYSTIQKPVQKNYGADYFWKLIVKFFMMLVLGMLLIYLWPIHFIRTYAETKTRPIILILWGILFLVVTPLVCVIAAITVIGLPLAFITFGLWLMSLYIAKILAAWIVGSWLKEKLLAKYGWSNNSILALGILVYILIGAIPYVGWIVAFILYLLAWGSVRFLMEKKK